MKINPEAYPFLKGKTETALSTEESDAIEKAKTPKEAMIKFAMALEDGDIDEMLEASVYEDKETMKLVYKPMVEMRSFEKELDKAYGEPQPGQMQMSMNTGGSFPSLEKIESDDLMIDENGDKASAHIFGEFSDKDTNLIKKDGNWYIDMISDTPSESEQEQALKLIDTLNESIKDAKSKIGKPGYTREKIETEFFGKLMSATMFGAAKPEEIEEPPSSTPASKEDEQKVLKLIQEVNDASFNGDKETLKRIISNDCQITIMGNQQKYWDIYTDEFLELVKSSKTTSTINETKIVYSSPERISAEINATSSSSMGGGSSRVKETFNKINGAWKLVKMDTLGFSMSTQDDSFESTSDKISVGQLSGYIRKYPGVMFKEIEPPFYAQGGSLFGVSESMMTCIEGVTSDGITDVINFYKEQLDSSWSNVRDSIGSHSSGGEMKNYQSLRGEKTFSDGKKTGINILFELDGSGTHILLVIAPIGQ